MSTKVQFIEKLSKLEGAAFTLANILCGRVIGQIARGFPDDPEVRSQAGLYLALLKLYPQDVVNVPTMWKRMLDNADDNSSALDGLDLSEQDKAAWADSMGESEKDRMRNAAPIIAKVMQEEGPTADIKAWYDLSPLAQHSLAVRTERNLFNAITRYESWTSEEGARLRKVCGDAVQPLETLVNELCESLKDDIDAARSNGVRVAQRQAA